MSESVNPAPEGGDNLTLDIQDILRILPHRFPLLLVDRITHLTRTKRIVAIKNVTINEPFFAGHFPDHPIMPGVLVVEAMAQAGGVLLLTEFPDRAEKLLLFTGIERAQVSPAGDTRRPASHRGGRAGVARHRRPHAGQSVCRRQAGLRSDRHLPSVESSETGGSRPGARCRNRSSRNLPMNIHPTAIVDPSAKIPASCSIGPYCTVAAGVELGENCELVSHVVLGGPVDFGSNNKIYPFAALGMDPQDITYAGEPTRLEVGDHNVIREYVTITRGTAKGGGVTRIGSHTLIMAYTHVGHDCVIGDHVMLVNAATLAGHVTVEEWAVVGALCPVHQYVRVGAHAYVGGGTTLTQDVLPYSMTSAERDTHAYMLNKVGLQRRGFSRERIARLHHAFKVLLASKLNTSQALEKLRSEGAQGEDVEVLMRFIETSQRGIIK